MRIVVNLMGKALKSQYRRIIRSNQKIKNYFNGVMSWVIKGVLTPKTNFKENTI